MKNWCILIVTILFFSNVAIAQQEQKEEVYILVEVMPEYPGGDDSLMAYLSNSLKYPQKALENNIEGMVVVKFIVNKEGKVTKTQILRDIGGGCGAEALRIVSAMPKWKPGTQKGKNVNVYFNLPVRFKLPEK